MCFVIPTYNEALNVTPLLQRLCGLYADDEIAFLIVDDESPDGTAHLVREFARGDSRVHLLQGQRRGLGDAYVRGITYALEKLDAEIVVQMDADFSHDPAAAGLLLARITDPGDGADGVDVAIGSRYVAGGGVDEDWSLRRKLLSRWGNRMARWIAGLSSVYDCTAGFKAIKAEALRAAKVEDIRVQGYAFQVVLLHRLLHAGARIVEEPVYFRERARGQTKLGMRDLIEFFYNVWWLRLSSHRTFIKFAITGFSGAIINLGSFQILHHLGLHDFVASPIAIELSIIWNFLINNYWTFAERDLAGRNRVRGLKFNLVSLGTLALMFSTFVVLSILLPNAQPVLWQGIAILPAVLVNYFLNSYWTFRAAQPAEGGKK